MSDGVWLLLANIAVGTLTLTGVWLTVRQSKRATETAAETEQRADEAESWDRLNGRLQEELDRVWARLREMDEQHGKDVARISALERNVADTQRRYRAAVRFIRELLAWARVVVPGQQPPPFPPDLRPEFD